MPLTVWEGRLKGTTSEMLSHGNTWNLCTTMNSSAPDVSQPNTTTLWAQPPNFLTHHLLSLYRASPEWIQQAFTLPVPPKTSWLHFSFPCLLSPEPIRNNFNQFVASPSRFSFYFCKTQILGQFKHLHWGYWELLEEIIVQKLLDYNNGHLGGWKRTISKLTIGYLKYFLSQESKLASLGINTVESQRQEVGPREREGRVKGH